LWRTPAQAARELLWLAAVLTLLAPLAHGILTGRWLWHSACSGQWSLFWMDATALGMSIGFMQLARASTRRAQHGDPNSVWAD